MHQMKNDLLNSNIVYKLKLLHAQISRFADWLQVMYLRQVA